MDVKKKLKFYPKINIKKIKSKISDYKFVSFDLYDTLIKRNVNEPKDLFQIIDRRLRKVNIIIEDFVNKRINYEQELRNKSTCEITITEIYEFFGLSKEDTITAVNVEEQTEVEYSTPNKKLIDLLNFCKKENKKILIITDIYLSEKCIKNIISKNNLECDFLFVSSEISKTKRTGELYDFVMKELNVSPDELIHIGDSFKSDFLMAKNKRIKSILIPNKIRNLSFNYENQIENVDDNVLLTIANNNISDSYDYYQKFGYEKFGPFMVMYSKYIYQKLIENGISKVYFFSRDGYIMKQFFDSLYKEKNIKTYYLEVSRRSLRVPTIWMNMELEDVIRMICPSSCFTISSFFESIGLDLSNYKQLLVKYNFKENNIVYKNNVFSNKEFLELYDDIKKDVECNSKEEFEALKKYLDENNIGGKFAIVDIGWSGSMQKYLTQTLDFLNINHDIMGLYTGVASYFKNNVKSFDMNMNGFVFDIKNNKGDVDLRSGFVGLFESLFLENAGSVKKYIIDSEENVIVERYPYEYAENDKITEDAKIIKKIQKSAIEYLNDFKLNVNYIDDIIPSKSIFNGIFETGANPSKKDIKYLGKLSFYDDGNLLNLINFKNHFGYLMNPKKLKEDLFMSRWKVAFLKKLFVFKLDNYKIYSFLKRRIEK